MERAARGLLAVVVVLACAPAQAGQATSAERATRGALYLAGRQAATGAFFSADAPADSVAEALAVVAAAPVGDAPVRAALGYIAEHGARRSAERAAYAARITLGLISAGRDPRAFHGDHVEQVTRRYDQIKGTYDDGLYSNALAVLALSAADEQIPERVLTMFETNVCRDGGFGHEEACVTGADTDTTAMVAMAVTAWKGASAGVVRGARAWLRDNQLAGGGWGARPGDAVNANSTGLAVSAIVAIGEDPVGATWRARDGSPMDAVASLQLPSGAFRYLASDERANDYATVQAVPALARRAYPVKPWKSARVTTSERTQGVSEARHDISTEPARADGTQPSDGSSGRAATTASGLAIGSSATPNEPTPPRAPVPLAMVMLLLSGGLLVWRITWSGAR